MGAANTKIEDEKALQLCRDRNKFVRKALDGRCALAESHVAYIQSLRKVGAALRKFVEPEAVTEPSPYASITTTPDPLGSFQKTRSHLSFASPPLSFPVDTHSNLSPSPSTHSSSRFEVNRMQFRSFSSKKVEEKPPETITGTLTTSDTPTENTPRSGAIFDESSFEVSASPSGDTWDYFNMLQPTDDHFSFQKGTKMAQGFENSNNFKHDEEGGEFLRNGSFHDESDECETVGDEFDESPSEGLVRKFKNSINVKDHDVPNTSAMVHLSQKIASESELINGADSNSPSLSPLRRAPSGVTFSAGKKAPVKDDQTTQKEFSMDFISSLREIEQLFIRASETGKEVPRMLEANKLHFRPILQRKESGIAAASLVRSCFSCGNDPLPVQEEPAQNSVKYLTWHRTTSSSSRSPLEINDEMEDSSSNLFDNSCMISGSHASTLDRLYAWERKLYDEVKASQVVRREYDEKCKLLRQLESKAVSEDKIYKTRADVKDLHSRIRVAIQRIDSISKRIEELRDKELQPQVIELIKGLSRMWKGMSECHKMQLNIISTAYDSGSNKINVQSDAHRQITLTVESELKSLSSCFMNWIDDQTLYLEAINGWLFQCVSIAQNQPKRKRRAPTLAEKLRDKGPSIYSICGVWLEESKVLPAKEVQESIKGLAAEINRFLPLHEKNLTRTASSAFSKAEGGSNIGAADILREEASEDCISRFRSSLVGFLGQLSNFAEFSVKMYEKLESIIDTKCNFDRHGSQ